MAFPVPESITPTVIDTAASSHPINMPATVAAGKIIVIAAAIDDEIAGGVVPTTPTDWTQVESRNSALKVWGKLYAKLSDGTEGGTTVDIVTPGKNVKAAARTIVYSGAYDDLATGLAAIGTVHTSTANPDSPSLNPAWNAGEDTLWQSFTMRRVNNTITSGPASYTLHTPQTKTATNGAKIEHATRELAADSEDPGQWQENTAADCVSFTVAIRPAATATAVRSANSASASSGTAVAVPMGAGSADGDLIFVVVHANGETITITDNNGATPFSEDVAEFVVADGSGTGSTVSVFSRRRVSGDPTTFNFTLGSSARWAAGTVSIMNPHATVIYDVANTTNIDATADTTCDVPSITTATAGAIHLAIPLLDGAGNSTTSVPSGYTEVVNVNVAGVQPLTIAHKTISAAGATGIQTFNCEALTTDGGISIAIRPNTGVASYGGVVSFFEFQTPEVLVIEPPPARRGAEFVILV